VVADALPYPFVGVMRLLNGAYTHLMAHTFAHTHIHAHTLSLLHGVHPFAPLVFR